MIGGNYFERMVVFERRARIGVGSGQNADFQTKRLLRAQVGVTAKKNAGEVLLPGAREVQVGGLEFVAQGELHYARVGVQARIIAEIGTGAVDRVIDALDVEADMIGDVENLPAELDAVMVGVGHDPTFGETHIYAEETRAAEVVALAGLSRKRLDEIELCVRTLSKGVDDGGIGRTLENTGGDWSGLVSIAGKVPVGGPLGTVKDTEGKTASETEETRKLPAADDSVLESINRARELFATTEG